MINRAEELIAKGEWTLAVSILQEVLKKDIRNYQARLLLSKCLYEQGNYKEALINGQKAEQFDPLSRDFAVVQQHMQKRDFNEAKKVAQQMLLKQTAHPRAIFTLAHVAMANQTPEESTKILTIGLDHSPANIMLRHMLIQSLESSACFAQAINEAKILCSIEESFDTLWLYITLLLKYGQNIELLSACTQAIKLAREDQHKLSQVHIVLGQTYRILGEREKCIAAYRKCLDINPNNADAWWGLADLKNYAFTQEDKTALEALSIKPNLNQKTRSIIFFVLARIHESLSNWKVAMQMYDKANRSFPVANNSTAQIDTEFATRKKVFTQQTLTIQADKVNSDLRPIFIVGLPRSGSTMVEQILASHSQIEGTLEQTTLPAIERQANAICLQKSKANLFSAIDALTPTELSQLGHDYIAKGALFRTALEGNCAGTRFYTDKQPFNFRHVGLIHKILPNALIIDIRRNPLDCGFSLFKQYFLSGVDFSYNLKYIAHFYNAYLNLMDFWDKQLPNKILHVQYEDIVRSPEFEIKRLLAHIGVEFEQNCLHFHKSKRVVRTASSEQVRQPINTKGIGVWRNVEDELLALKEALGNKTLTRYSEHFS